MKYKKEHDTELGVLEASLRDDEDFFSDEELKI